MSRTHPFLWHHRLVLVVVDVNRRAQGDGCPSSPLTLVRPRLRGRLARLELHVGVVDFHVRGQALAPVEVLDEARGHGNRPRGD